MVLLYRGVSKKLDFTLNGQIKPRGCKSEVTAFHNGKIKRDGTFTRGESEDNAVRAQHIDSGLYDNCFVSTTKNVTKALEFATSTYSEPGWINVIDSNAFKDYEVISKEFSNPLYPDEMEISIRDKNCGCIPMGVIIEKYEVDNNGERKT